MAGIYVLCVLASGVFFIAGLRMEGEDRVAFLVNSVIFAAIGLPLAILCALPFFLPRKPWVWIYDLVIICIGLTSCCTMVASIPLLIYWLKPDVKAWFERS